MSLTRHVMFGDDQPGMLKIEKETTFGVAPGSPVYLRTIGNPGGIDKINRYMMEDGSLRQTLNKLAMIPGFKDAGGYFTLPLGTTITTKTYLHGFASAVPSAKTAYSDAGDLATGLPTMFPVYGALGGLKITDAYGEVDSTGSTVQVIELVNGDDVDVGSAITIDVSATAVPEYQTGWVISKTAGAGGAATVRVDFGAIPAAGKKVFGSVVCYDKSYLTDSFSLSWYGHATGSTTPLALVLVGCVPSQTVLDFPVFGPPTAETTWMVTAAKWDAASSTFATPQAWSYPAAEQSIGHRVQLIPGMAHDAAVALDSVSLTVTINNALKQIESHGATYGISSCVKTAQNITVALKFPYDGTIHGYFTDQTVFGIEAEFGSQPGKRVALAMPALVAESFSGPVSEGGVAYCDLTARALTYAGDTGDHDEDSPGDKAIAFAWC